MRPVHWLDGVLGDLRDVDDIALAIAESPKFRQAIQKGIDAAFQWEGLRTKKSITVVFRRADIPVCPRLTGKNACPPDSY